MGGRVAQWLAIDHPDAVRSLVFAASGPGPAEGTAYSRVGVPIPMTLDIVAHGYDREFYKRAQLRSFFTERFASEFPHEVDWLVDACWNSAPSLHDYLKHVVARQAHAACDGLARVPTPALICVGGEDTHHGGTGSHIDEAVELGRLLPHAREHTIEGVRHGLFWERPVEMADLIIDWTESYTRAAGAIRT
jgi:pimeloyl-ACP methyl ester carboxylesterase